MAKDYGLAQPIYDAAKGMYDKAKNLFGYPSTPAGKSSGSSTDSGKLPSQWEEANEKSRQEQLGRKKLTADGPTLGGKKKAKAKTRKAEARKKG